LSTIGQFTHCGVKTSTNDYYHVRNVLMHSLLDVKGYSKALNSDTENTSAKVRGHIILHVLEKLQTILVLTKVSKIRGAGLPLQTRICCNLALRALVRVAKACRADVYDAGDSVRKACQVSATRRWHRICQQ
jgi:hypothetical protein